MYAFMRAYRGSDDGLAVVRGKTRITFKALLKKIDRVAGGLYALGVRKGDVVVSALPNIQQGVVLLYAASKLGAVLSPVHPQLSKEEFEREVALQNPKVVVLSDVNLFSYGALKSGAKLVFCPYWLDAYVGLPIKRKYEEYNGDGEIPALYMHSGGTSGAPKTVVLSAKAANELVVHLLSSIPYSFGVKDGMLVTLPMFHGFGLIVGVHASLSTNMKAVLVPKFDGERAVKAIADNAVTTLIAVPRMLKKLLETESFEGENISSLANVYVGGDALPETLKSAFDKRLADAGATAVAEQGYGLTEVGSVCVLSPKDGADGSVGKAINGVETLIVGEDGKKVADGEQGELLLSSGQLMSGYLGDKGATDSAFTVVNGRKYLKTGDIFKIKDGYLYFGGRLKRLIKISGMNVFPSEIERVAAECGYPYSAAVEISVGGKTYIRLVVEGALDESQKSKLKKCISEKLSHWHLPKEIVSVGKLPRTAIGKIDFVRLQSEHFKD